MKVVLHKQIMYVNFFDYTIFLFNQKNTPSKRAKIDWCIQPTEMIFVVPNLYIHNECTFKHVI